MSEECVAECEEQRERESRGNCSNNDERGRRGSDFVGGGAG